TVGFGTGPRGAHCRKIVGMDAAAPVVDRGRNLAEDLLRTVREAGLTPDEIVVPGAEPRDAERGLQMRLRRGGLFRALLRAQIGGDETERGALVRCQGAQGHERGDDRTAPAAELDLAVSRLPARRIERRLAPGDELREWRPDEPFERDVEH